MKPANTRAIVIGGSICGLSAARVLSDHFSEVVVFEKDVPHAQPMPRKGVPQGIHTQGLPIRGQRALEELFPGIIQALTARGGFYGDIQETGRVYCDQYKLAHGKAGISGLSTTRLLIENEIRRRAGEIKNVKILTGSPVVALKSEGKRVTGVKYKAQKGEEGEAGPELEMLADLVIDAAGRNSRSPGWLKELGFQPAPESTFAARLTYLTGFFEYQEGDAEGAGFIINIGTKNNPNFGIAMSQEPDWQLVEKGERAPRRWTVSLGAYNEAGPAETTLEAMKARAIASKCPDFIKITHERKFVGPIVKYAFSSSLRRHYEKLKEFPEGYLVMGDAVASYNPTYGQGMSSSYLQVLALAKALGKGHAQLWKRFFPLLPSFVDNAWKMAVEGDQVIMLDPKDVPFSAKMSDRIVRTVLKVGSVDPAVGLQFMKVLHMLEPPTSLASPKVVFAILKYYLSGKRAQPVALAGNVAELRPAAVSKDANKKASGEG